MISEEHAAIVSYRTSEIGVVGADENDETAYLKKRGNALGDAEEQSETEGGGDQKLSFPRGKLYGRKEELTQLQTLYEDVIETKQQSQVVLLKGYSGCGKTALVEQFIQEARKKKTSKPGSQEQDTPPPPGLTPICIKGKYEEPNDRGDGTTSPPYKGILEALSFWYISLSASERKAIDPVGQKIRETLGEDAQLLVEILPSLKRLWLGQPDKQQQKDEDASTTTGTPSLTASNNNGTPMKNKKRMHFVFYSLFKCLCASQANALPVVFFCDDLQWADAHTLELLLHVLTTAKENGPLSLFVILSARCNHDSAPPPVADMEQQLLQPLDSSTSTTLTTIHVNNLTKADLGLFIADTLQSEDHEYILPLRDAIYSISLGNMFFAIQALEELARRNILYFDMMCFEWTWVDLSDESVLSDLISKDVMDLVTSKLQHMPPTLQNLLTVAAYTRSTLDANTWWDIYNACTDIFESFGSHSNLYEDDNPQLPKESLLKLLRMGEEEGLLKSNGMNIDLSKSSLTNDDDNNICYAFAHDQIRVASRVFPHNSPQRNSLLQRIGNALAKRGRSETVGEDWMLFTAMQQLNSIPRHYHGYSEDTQLGLARLNLETAQLAVGRAAFDDAAHCLKKAIQFLTTHDDNPWKRHFELCASIYALAAEVAQMRGNVPELEKYSYAYLEAAQHLPIEANLRVYYTLARGLVYATDRCEEAKGIVLELLERLGLSFPPAKRRKSQAVRQMKSLVSTGKSPKTLERLENLEHMTDETLLKRMQLLDLLFDICFVANDESLLLLVIFEGFVCTLKAGLSMHSPRFVGMVGFVFVTVLGDIAMAGQYGSCALQLMKAVNIKATEAATLLVAYDMGCCWVQPLRDCIQPLRHGYEVGMHCGKADVAMACVINLLLFQFYAGIALPVLDDECREFMPLLEEYNGQRTLAIAGRRIWNVILTLLGKDHSDDPVEMSEAEKVNPKNVGVLEMFHRLEKGYGGDYESCADSFVQSGTPKCYAGNAFVTNDVFVSAISCIAMARQKRSCCGDVYSRRAKQLRKVVSSWVQKGNPNAKHWKLLLDAEFAALKKRNQNALAAYESAAELASAGGYIHDAALFYERWGLFAAEEVGGESAAEAENILQKSARLFLQWGSPKRAQLVRERIPKRVESACLK